MSIRRSHDDERLKRAMRFVYLGFEHAGDIRSFNFQGIDRQNVESSFSINVSLLLFAQNKVSMQDAPQFCLRMLEGACSGETLGTLHEYSVIQNDLLGVLNEREERRSRKASTPVRRRLIRKPSQDSQIPRVHQSMA